MRHVVHKQTVSRSKAHCGHMTALGLRATLDEAKVTCQNCLRRLAPHSLSAAERLKELRRTTKLRVTHLGDRGYTMCGKTSPHCVSNPVEVTCGSCLRVVAKRARADA